ncbi:hypothetical protein D9M72_363930 [compost metagenome]
MERQQSGLACFCASNHPEATARAGLQRLCHGQPPGIRHALRSCSLGARADIALLWTGHRFAVRDAQRIALGRPSANMGLSVVRRMARTTIADTRSSQGRADSSSNNNCRARRGLMDRAGPTAGVVSRRKWRARAPLIAQQAIATHTPRCHGPAGLRRMGWRPQREIHERRRVALDASLRRRQRLAYCRAKSQARA